jgi:predicted MPP superfamily phosphohydrolase
MQILITADWHLDEWSAVGRNPLLGVADRLNGLDALILAGDLAEDPLRTWPAVLDWIGQRIDPAKVHVIPGNHDYYDHRFDGDDALRAVVEAAGMQLEAMRRALWMADFERIARDAGGALITPADTAAAHADHLDWLTRAIRAPHAGQTVVVTHHLPSASVAGSLSPLSPFFASDLEGWILHHQPALWLCGHAHRHQQARIGTTLIRDISLGYPDEMPEGAEIDLLFRGLIDTTHSDLLVD